MALKITDTCINCDVCAPVCPNEAIYEGELIYEIDPDLCTECVGHFDKPQCQVVCPVECIPWDEDHKETQKELLAKSKRLEKERQEKEKSDKVSVNKSGKVNKLREKKNGGQANTN